MVLDERGKEATSEGLAELLAQVKLHQAHRGQRMLRASQHLSSGKLDLSSSSNLLSNGVLSKI